MASTQRYKVSDKQAVVKKLVTALKKHYKGSPPREDRPVLETLMYAVCLEDASYTQADASWERLNDDFFDFNEIRVSSITELSRAFGDTVDSELRSLRLRSVLHHVFEINFEFELESLRRKTLDQANKQLEKIRDLSPFVRAYTLQHAIGSHLIPTDLATQRVAEWMGLTEPGQSGVDAGEALKSVVRKPDGIQFCYLWRQLGTDPKMQAAFDPEQFPADEDGHDLKTAPARLKTLLAEGAAALKKAEAPAARKKPAKTKKAKAKKTGTNGSARKSATKSSTSRKTPARKRSPSKT